jgi:hypothetical protein
VPTMGCRAVERGLPKTRARPASRDLAGF